MTLKFACYSVRRDLLESSDQSIVTFVSRVMYLSVFGNDGLLDH